MYKIIFNNNAISIPENMLLSALLQQENYTEAGFAVAINRIFVPRAQYPTVQLKQNDQVDIILPMQGG